MNLIKQLIPNRPAVKFTPASSEVNWERIETLVHGPGAGEDKRTVNSAVFACLMTIALAYTEPSLVVKRGYKQKSEALRPDSPLQELLDEPTPNGELSQQELLFWTAWAKSVDGNAYWLKVRSGNETSGNVVELWPVSPTLIEPVTEKGSSDWISYYKYHDAPNHWSAVPVENVIHFRMGLDDHDMRKGLSPLKHLAREIATDEEASKFTAALLKNYAVPGLVVIPSAPTTLVEADADRITDRLRRKFGNDNRGNIAVLSRESTIQQFGFSPKDLDMTVLHGVPETRISAVMNVPAVLAGLGAGLDAATYNNTGGLRDFFTESNLVPQWRMDAAKINSSLTPDFTSNPQIFVEFDLTDVRALQEDEDAKYKRLQLATAGKAWMTRNEARSDIGLDAVPGWDDEDLAKPEPVPVQLQQAQDQQQQDQQAAPGETAKAAEIRKWWRVCARDLRAKKPITVVWQPVALSIADAERIGKSLMGCSNAQAIGEVFKRELGNDKIDDDNQSILEAIRLGVEALKVG